MSEHDEERRSSHGKDRERSSSRRSSSHRSPRRHDEGHKHRSRDREHRHREHSHRDSRDRRHDAENSSSNQRKRHRDDAGRHRDERHNSRPKHKQPEWDEEQSLAVPPGADAGLKRDDWMTAPTDKTESASDDVSYFSSLGTARVKAPRLDKPDPEKLKVSSRELNTQLVEGKSVGQYQTTAAERPEFGSPGHQWRMMKLKRVMDTAKEQKRKAEDVALERYASLEDFDYAQQERDFLDGKTHNVPQRSLLASGTNTPMSSRPGSRQGFRRPGEFSNPSTPTSAMPPRPPRNIGFDTPASKPSTPVAIPSVFTPIFERPSEGSSSAGVLLDDGSTDPDRSIMPADELNRLQAKIIKAELMGDPSASELKAQFERESARSKAHKSAAGDRGNAFGAAGVIMGADGQRELQVLPTLDGQGRMYDVGMSTRNDSPPAPNGRSSKRAKRDRFEARDPTTGEIVRYSADDDSVSLTDLVREEKFTAGARSQKDLDTELANNIMTDNAFSTDLEDQDEEAHRYARKQMKSDALKRQFAINDFAKTKRALDTCRFCWQDEGARPPRATVISTGYRAYLAIPDSERIVEGHVLIVPMQHHLSSLEADQDTWDEMKNFIKCLIQLAATRKQRMVFFETILSLKHQAHTVIEAVPIPEDVFSTLPGVFKESLRMEGGEFSSNSKVVSFTPERPFRKSLVPNLPYFAVSWDSNFATGYGHIIENMDKDLRAKDDENAFDIDELGSGSGFSKHFARQVIGGVLMDSADSGDDRDDFRLYTGKVRNASEAQKKQAKEMFLKSWDKFDWTKMLQ